MIYFPMFPQGLCFSKRKGKSLWQKSRQLEVAFFKQTGVSQGTWDCVIMNANIFGGHHKFNTFTGQGHKK